MRFLGGLLKFFGILLMLIGTAAATACCFFAVEDNDPSLYVVGGVVFLCFLLVALGILGAGTALSQIVKLKKKVAQLEQRLWSVPAASVPASAPVASVPASAPVASAPAEPVPVEDPVAEALAAAAPKTSGIKRWLPVILAGVLVVVAIVIVVAFTGGEKQQPAVEEPQIQQSVELPPVDVAEPEPTEGPALIEVVDLPLGSSLNTGWVEMTFDEVIAEEDIQKSVTVDNVTRVTGPDPLPGQMYLCLSGTIKNTSSSELPVYDFFEGRFQIGEYQYSVSANDCDILDAYGDPQYNIAPLMEYEYRIYTAIPIELADSFHAGEPASFTFGFYDGFDNVELSSNRAFTDDAIVHCPYQYYVPFH